MTREQFIHLLKHNRHRAVALLVEAKVSEWLDAGGPDEMERVLALWIMDGLNLGDDNTIIGLAEGRLFE